MRAPRIGDGREGRAGGGQAGHRGGGCHVTHQAPRGCEHSTGSPRFPPPNMGTRARQPAPYLLALAEAQAERRDALHAQEAVGVAAAHLEHFAQAAHGAQQSRGGARPARAARHPRRPQLARAPRRGRRRGRRRHGARTARVCGAQPPPAAAARVSRSCLPRAAGPRGGGAGRGGAADKRTRAAPGPAPPR